MLHKLSLLCYGLILYFSVRLKKAMKMPWMWQWRGGKFQVRTRVRVHQRSDRLTPALAAFHFALTDGFVAEEHARFFGCVPWKDILHTFFMLYIISSRWAANCETKRACTCRGERRVNATLKAFCIQFFVPPFSLRFDTSFFLFHQSDQFAVNSHRCWFSFFEVSWKLLLIRCCASEIIRVSVCRSSRSY